MKDQELMKELGGLAPLFLWVKQHKTLTDIIIILEIIALMWMVLNYNFTTY